MTAESTSLDVRPGPAVADNAEEVLRARAQRLAARASTNTEMEDASVEYVVFGRGEERYALPVEWVQAVLDLRHPPVPVPQVPAYFLGLIRVRGAMTALFDVEMLLAAGHREKSR